MDNEILYFFQRAISEMSWFEWGVVFAVVAAVIISWLPDGDYIYPELPTSRPSVDGPFTRYETGRIQNKLMSLIDDNMEHGAEIVENGVAEAGIWWEKAFQLAYGDGAFMEVGRLGAYRENDPLFGYTGRNNMTNRMMDRMSGSVLDAVSGTEDNQEKARILESAASRRNFSVGARDVCEYCGQGTDRNDLCGCGATEEHDN